MIKEATKLAILLNVAFSRKVRSKTIESNTHSIKQKIKTYEVKPIKRVVFVHRFIANLTTLYTQILHNYLVTVIGLWKFQ